MHVVYPDKISMDFEANDLRMRLCSKSSKQDFLLLLAHYITAICSIVDL